MSIEQEKSIFLEAIDLGEGAARDAFLDQACAGNAALREAVEELLALHDRSRNVVDHQLEPSIRLKGQSDEVLRLFSGPASAIESTRFAESPADRVGERIGPYRLMEKIGEGGFGEVYVAEQNSPIRRRVALKLLKPWMDSREVIARFEAERQALALMDHPHIARVLDAGSTSNGQPYFVMELVRGTPITDFCEQHRLNIRQRLSLIADVCDAVQHAHQRGVIHRDLKPSNVMVTLHDVTPIVKVIDFGVSKAIGEPLTDKTIYTRFAQMIGTPAYMSPEQAEMNAFDVDTRSDVYSLGVLLYELLTGTTPFDRKRLNTVAFDELRRIICEEDPPRPSIRLTTLSKSSLTKIATPILDAERSISRLRGELDWVVMKALEKDRRRRYESAADLARDVRRYLHQEPVIARPPSKLYSIQKFAQRHRVLFASSSLVLMALLAGTAVSLWQAIRATQAYQEADALRREAVEFADRLKEANVLLDSARANAEEQRWSLAWKQYTKATELQPDHYLAWSGRGSLSAQLGAWEHAAADFNVAVDLGAPANNPGWWGVPQLFLYADKPEAYERVRTALLSQLENSDDPASIMMAARSVLLQPVTAEQAAAIILEIEQTFEEHPFPRGLRGSFGGPPFQMLRGAGPRNASAPEFRPGRPPGNPARMIRTLELYTSALAYYRAGKADEALNRLNSVLTAEQPISQSVLALPVLAMTYHALGRTEEAEAALLESSTELNEWITDFQDNPPESPWFNFLEGLVLYREAHLKIRGTSLPDDPQLARLEQQAMTILLGN